MFIHKITKAGIVTTLSVLLFFQTAQGGSEGLSGGGRPSLINEYSVKSLLKSQDFKKAIVNYLHSIPTSQLTENTREGNSAQAILNKVLSDDLLIRDINTSNNYKTEGWCPKFKLADEAAEPSLIDHDLDQALACTQIGKFGAEIYFKTAELGEVYRNLTSEEMMIKLAGLALHEHIHHFQDPTKTFKFNENQSNIFSAYFINHSRIKDTPLFEWTLSPQLAELTKAKGIINYFEKGNNHAFIRIIKDKNYQLSFEFCITTEKCKPIEADKKINIFEAWVHGEQLHTEELTLYSTKFSLALSIFTYPLGTATAFATESTLLMILRALGSKAIWALSEARAMLLAVPISLVVNAELHPYLSSYNYDFETSDLLHKLDTKPTTQEPQIITIEGEIPLSALTTKISKFIQETRKLQEMSIEALRQWDESD